MRTGTVCTGIGAPEQAGKKLGWKPQFFSEIEPFPCAVLAHHYPDVPNLGDMTKILENETVYAKPIDLLCGGTPCFASDTLVLTEKGMIPINDVRVGDKVLTHTGNWRKVLRIGSKIANTVVLKGQGARITTTPNHRFYASLKGHIWDNEKRRYLRTFSDLNWVEAKDLANNMWVIPCNHKPLSIPQVSVFGNEKAAPEFSPEFMKVVGLYLGNGWLRLSKRRSYVLLCCGKHTDLSSSINAAGFKFSKTEERTSFRYQIASSSFAKWLNENFGKYAYGKRIPGWCYSMPNEWRASLFEGYMETDGCLTAKGYKSTSVSKSLSYGMGMLSVCLGKTFSMSHHTNKRNCVIEGRRVNERENFCVEYCNNSRTAFIKDGYMYGLVRKVDFTNKKETVYDLEVETDHSYTANGIVVHNCQSFSVAGLRKGLDDPRGNLALTFLAIADRLRPTWVVWENVPGVLSSANHTAPDPSEPPPPVDMGRDGQEVDTEDGYHSEELHAFECFLAGLSEIGYGVAYRVFDAQYFGVAQRRERVFVVGYLGDWRPAAAVLFEPDSMQGNPAPRKKKREGPPAFASSGIGGYGESEVAGTCRAAGGDYGEGSETLAFGGGNTSGPLAVSACLTAKGQRCDFEVETFVVPVAVIPTGFTLHGTDGTTSIATESNIAFGAQNSSSQGDSVGEVSPTLDKSKVPGVYVPRVAHTLTSEGYNASSYGTSRGTPITGSNYNGSIRRLTPPECERLMGFPDGYTLIPTKKWRRIEHDMAAYLSAQGATVENRNGKWYTNAAADGPRYKALGNSMPVPVVEWIGGRINQVDEILKTR